MWKSLKRANLEIVNSYLFTKPWVFLWNDKNVVFQIEATADDNLNVAKLMEFVFDAEENILRKGKIAGSLPAVSPLPTIFQKASITRLVKENNVGRRVKDIWCWSCLDRKSV